eukprot:scaffold266934_cov35-Tisochrysis_lutea.AAC.2
MARQQAWPTLVFSKVPACLLTRMSRLYYLILRGFGHIFMQKSLPNLRYSHGARQSALATHPTIHPYRPASPHPTFQAPEGGVTKLGEVMRARATLTRGGVFASRCILLFS